MFGKQRNSLIIIGVLSVVLFSLLHQGVESATATNNCQVIKTDFNITVEVGETAYVNAEDYIDGYNLDYTVEPSDSFLKIKQIQTEMDSSTT